MESRNKRPVLLSQAIHSNDRYGLVGVEFVIEIIDSSTESSVNYCTMCSKIYNQGEIIAHMMTDGHIISFLKIYFPTIQKILENDPFYTRDDRYRKYALIQIATLIENQFGVYTPNTLYAMQYKNKKAEIYNKIGHKMRKLIVNEAIWPECLEVFLQKLLMRLEDALDRAEDNGEDDWYKQQKSDQEAKNLNYYETLLSNIPKVCSIEDIENRISEAVQRDHSRDIARFEVRIEMKQFEKELKKYAQFPEKHPQFQEVWDHFWSTLRYYLQADERYIIYFNYRATWNKFWDKKLKEHYNSMFDNLGYEEIQLITNYKTDCQISNNIFALMKQEIEKLENLKETPEGSKTKMILDDFCPHAFLKNLNFEDPLSNFHDSYLNAPMNFLKVCQFLTTLQPELGILSAPIVHLYQQLDEIEENFPNLSDELFYIDKNRNILQGAVDKLKGVLSVNAMSDLKARAVKNGIEMIFQLVKYLDSRKPTLSFKNLTEILYGAREELKEHKMPEPLPPPILSEEKLNIEIAKTVAETLLKEGKTDVSNEELEKLINNLTNFD